MLTCSNTPAEQNEAYNTIYGYYFMPDTTPQQLLEQLLNLFEAQALGAIRIFVADPLLGESRLRLVHGLRKYPGPLAQPSLNTGNAFGYLDDIERDAGELVQVNSDMLSKTPASWVFSLGHHIAELNAHRQQPYIPAVQEGAAHSETISAHKAFFIPFELVPVLLGKGLSPWQAMGILYSYLNHEVLLRTYAPLLDTLRPVPTFRIEPGLTNYTKNKVLYRDIPSLNSPPIPPGDPVLTRAVTVLTDHQLRLSEGLDQRRSQSVGTTWGPLHTKCLVLLCGKLDETGLPRIYQAWAQKSKHKKTHMLFHSQVTTRASELGIQAPLVTAAILKRLQDGNFHGTDPFNPSPPGGPAETLKREQEAAANVAAYDTMISTEGNSLTLKDSLELQKTKAYIPVDWTEATTQLESYLAVLATVLGINHEVVKSYQQGLLRLKIQQMPLQWAIADEMGELLTPAIVVYYLQIRVRGWLEEQWESAFTIPSFDFGEDFQHIPDPPQVTNTGYTGISNINNGHINSNSAGIHNPGSPGAPAQARLTSPNRDSRLKDSNHPIVKKLEVSKMREAIQAMRNKGKGPLSHSDGQERCHSWHIKGVCFSACKHIYDHVAITPSKQDQLWEWCQEAYGG
eukprot:jgi/Psemu1/56628/gm1.56628_g